MGNREYHLAGLHALGFCIKWLLISLACVALLGAFGMGVSRVWEALPLALKVLSVIFGFCLVVYFLGYFSAKETAEDKAFWEKREAEKIRG